MDACTHVLFGTCLGVELLAKTKFELFYQQNINSMQKLCIIICIN